jgi:hypothetical protein
MFSDFLKMKEILGDNVSLPMSFIANLLNIDKDIVNQITEQERKQGRLSSAEVIENEMLESESAYKRARAIAEERKVNPEKLSLENEKLRAEIAKLKKESKSKN